MAETIHRKSSIYKVRITSYLYDKYVKDVIGTASDAIREVAVNLGERMMTIKTKSKRDTPNVDHREL